MPSVASLLLAAGLLQVPFGSSVEVHVQGSAALPRTGSVIGEFLVVGRPQPSEDGSTVVTLRPLALGELAVPLLGDPQPSRVEVQPTLAPDTPPQPLVLPRPAPVPWAVLAAPAALAALGLLAVRLLRRRSRRDPLAELQGGLRPLATPAAWATSDAADLLARTCRGFLQSVTGSPCAAMTTRELSRLLAARTEAAVAMPFGLALVLADETRFAGSPPPVEEAVSLVRDVLGAAPRFATKKGVGR